MHKNPADSVGASHSIFFQAIATVHMIVLDDTTSKLCLLAGRLGIIQCGALYNGAFTASENINILFFDDTDVSL